MEKTQENFFGGWFQPVKKEPKKKYFGRLGCACGGDDPLCDVCTKLRKPVHKIHIQGVDDFNWQFDSPLAGWTSEMKDSAMQHNGSLGETRSKALGLPFQGRLLPHRKPYGSKYHPVIDKCFKAGPPNGVRYVNSFRESTENCEAVCGSEVCKEYGNALERYAECINHENVPNGKPNHSLCGPRPKNPKNNNCKGCGSSLVDYAMNSYQRWLPDMACRKKNI